MPGIEKRVALWQSSIGSARDWGRLSRQHLSFVQSERRRSTRSWCVCLCDSPHTHTQVHVGEAGMCVVISVGRSRGMYGYGVVGLQQRQQEEHLRLSWHQVLLSCPNESNLPSPLLPSLTKQISFAVCSSLLIQLPQALCWVHQLEGPSLIWAAHCHTLIGIKYHQF